ncbi:MAG: YceH family protein [Acidimicrobiia bacterium]|nr:YceH family protein [Acidimicrobiia bacterium]
MELTPPEQRVLGCLIEKEMTTPDYYPMSLNSIVMACNQRSNRDPVVDYTELEVQETLDALRERGLARTVHGKGDRVLKYKHVAGDVLELTEAQKSLLAVLLLRGPQTGGELRTRTGRYCEFNALDEVVSELAALAGREEPLAERLERRPGEKEPRYTHLLGAVPDDLEPATPTQAEPDRIEQLEAELAQLRARVARMESELGLES